MGAAGEAMDPVGHAEGVTTIERDPVRSDGRRAVPGGLRGLSAPPLGVPVRCDSLATSYGAGVTVR
jgi:hypothetical protein